ncbi:adenylate/guanylate cyclase domain-containing protein [Rhizobium sp. BE258]|jgi:class 3 adenylate cyclase|uniref:adenylate/guanylate cyclase domain-containing protein n=1 Tax=Rhizobium sp. BE258 TaxID=2817722 RepID=UPI00285AE893|nr:adenylate/guanylate cyclase domain-containing protein [Rhizobium sp. BE258]MDR7144200.1 class 3 adenylate cyclase [Rhizobium sp. BE258]
MSETQRRLTTIFSADVQDYTRLMGLDEEGTLATLKRYREAMSGLIATHGGRVVNTWGDGLIAEFPSVVEAVRAAVDVQTELAGFNSAKPASEQMLFRIGINLGDIIVEGADIYGDGVNIAARLQASAPAGGIVISNTVYDQVRNKVPVGFDFLGPLSVKNVSEAIPSYAIRIGESHQAQAVAQAAPSGAPAAAARPDQRPTASPSRARKLLGIFAIAAAFFALINALTWEGNLWAVWPILVLAFAAAMTIARLQNRVDQQLAGLAIIGLGLIAINLLSWSGTFWAIWPLMAFAAVGAIRWVMRG